MALKFVAKFDERVTDQIVKKLKRLKRPVTATEAGAMGKAVVREMRGMISKGISPIRDIKRMEPYRGGYKDRIRKKGSITVGGIKFTKRLRPVNLKLTGKFLKALKSKVERSVSGFSPIVGYFKQSEQLKEQGHREQKNDQGFRPTIPQAPREQFALKIQQIILKFLNSALKKQVQKK